MKPFQRKVFYLATDEKEAKEIAERGFICKQSSAEMDNILGQSHNGVQFSKHIDVLLNFQYSNKSKTFFVIQAQVRMTPFFCVDFFRENRSVN